jgi:alpha-glucoside transport system ATP-binding protein
MATMVLKNIKKDYDGIKVLHGIDLEINDGEFVVFIGESGCGKSTLLRMICGLEEISSGELYLDGVLANEISPQKRDMSMVFQSYALYPHMNVYNNIAYGLKIAKIDKKSIEKKVQNASKLLYK